MIIHSTNTQDMLKQYIEFEAKLVTVAGKVSSPISVSMDKTKPVGVTHFMPEKQDPLELIECRSNDNQII